MVCETRGSASVFRHFCAHYGCGSKSRDMAYEVGTFRVTINDERGELWALYSNREFSQIERVVLDLANSMTLTPAKVSEDLFLKLQECFDPLQIVEITTAIAWENCRSRLNHALGIESHGFSEGTLLCSTRTRLKQHCRQFISYSNKIYSGY